MVELAPSHLTDPASDHPSGHVIVLGNEKGGTGKSTTAMHLVVALMYLGRHVGVIDLDYRQRSLARYIENRQGWADRVGVALRIPDTRVIPRSKRDSREAAEAEELAAFDKTLAELRAQNEFVIIDSPGSDAYLARLGHAAADTLITPLNDSFVDFDLLALVDPETFEVKSPSHYSEMVWESRKRRALKRGRPIDWIVMRNRLTSLDAKNKRRLADMLDSLAARIGFRTAPGFGERVIYRELFPRGLTLLDLAEVEGDFKMTMSHVAARQELRDLLSTLDLPGIAEKLQAI